MKRWLIPGVVFLLTLCSGPAFAARPEIYLEADGALARLTGSPRIDDAQGFGGRLGLLFHGNDFADSLGVELSALRLDGEGGSLGSADIDLYSAALLYEIPIKDQHRWAPGITLGLGWMRADPDLPGEETLALAWGLGVRWFATRNLALRLDVRHWVTDDDGTRQIYAATGGLQLVFGRPWPRPKRVAKEISDRDRDGVEDERDACPDTPVGSRVDERGCVPPPPPDSDGDGVPDAGDRCPGTPSGLQVNPGGCPPDGDGDGVYDVNDACPDTPKGVPVRS
ncbi:MAG: hypothetical protein D6685_18465, partial [Bacteroidetes bacterium]